MFTFDVVMVIIAAILFTVVIMSAIYEMEFVNESKASEYWKSEAQRLHLKVETQEAELDALRLPEEP